MGNFRPGSLRLNGACGGGPSATSFTRDPGFRRPPAAARPAWRPSLFMALTLLADGSTEQSRARVCRLLMCGSKTGRENSHSYGGVGDECPGDDWVAAKVAGRRGLGRRRRAGRHGQPPGRNCRVTISDRESHHVAAYRIHDPRAARHAPAGAASSAIFIRPRGPADRPSARRRSGRMRPPRPRARSGIVCSPEPRARHRPPPRALP